MIANQIPEQNIIKPPHSQEAEAAIIAAILSYGKQDQRVREVMDSLSADMFYSQLAADTYRYAHRVKECDLITVTDAMESDGYFEQNGRCFADIAEYGRSSFLIGSLPKYSEIVRANHAKRHLMAVANNIIEQAAGSATPDEIVEYANQQLTSLDLTTDYNPSFIGDLLDPWLEQVQARAAQDASVVGVETGIKRIDDTIVGIGKTWLVILAGRPSHGKSLVAQIIGNYIALSAPVLFMSMEMSEFEIMDRNLGMMARIAPSDMRRGLIEGEAYTRFVNATKRVKDGDYQLWYDETPSLTIDQVCARAKAFKKRHPNAALIQIDYLGLMETPKSERNDLGVGKITKRLKQLSKEIQTPIMLIAQLNRDSDKQARPQMRNLADSASIERDADLVMFVHQPEIQNPDCDANERGIIEILCGKHRHGPMFPDAAIRNTGDSHDELSIDELASLSHSRDLGKRQNKGGF